MKTTDIQSAVNAQQMELLNRAHRYAKASQEAIQILFDTFPKGHPLVLKETGDIRDLSDRAEEFVEVILSVMEVVQGDAVKEEAAKYWANVGIEPPSALTVGMAEKVSQLEKQVAEILPESTTKGERDSTANEAAELWKDTVEPSLSYSRGLYESYGEVADNAERDLSLLGRISQEVTFAHLCRNSTSDYSVRNNAGQPMSDQRYEEAFFFLDRLSSMFLIMRDSFRKLSREEK